MTYATNELAGTTQNRHAWHARGIPFSCISPSTNVFQHQFWSQTIPSLATLAASDMFCTQLCDALHPWPQFPSSAQASGNNHVSTKTDGIFVMPY
jgi:hypothetical protein